MLLLYLNVALAIYVLEASFKHISLSFPIVWLT